MVTGKYLSNFFLVYIPTFILLYQVNTEEYTHILFTPLYQHIMSFRLVSTLKGQSPGSTIDTI